MKGVTHANTVENVWSMFKRGMKGVYQHCGKAHLHRYLAEFDFRYNNRSALKISDRERTGKIMERIEGKRLSYRRIGETQNAWAVGAQIVAHKKTHVEQAVMAFTYLANLMFEVINFTPALSRMENKNG